MRNGINVCFTRRPLVAWKWMPQGLMARFSPWNQPPIFT